MPIYEFVCQACRHEFEQIVPFSATKLPNCPACHSEQVQRQLSRPAIHFKGSGWYITDSKASKTPANGKDSDNGKEGKEGEKAGPTESSAESKESATSTKSESKSETKSESKNETKSETKAATTTD